MPGLRLKQGITLNGVQPEIVLAIMVVAQIYEDNDSTLTITSLTDGIEWRSRNSLHPSGCAFDCRIWDFKTKAEQEAVCHQIRMALGPEFDVVLEGDHIHIEFDVKDK